MKSWWTDSKRLRKCVTCPLSFWLGVAALLKVEREFYSILFYSIPIQPILFILVSQVYVYFSTVGGSSFWHHAKFDDAKNQGSCTTSEFLGLRHPEGRYGQVMIIIEECLFFWMSFRIWRGCHVFFLCKSLCPHVFGLRKVWSLYRFVFYIILASVWDGMFHPNGPWKKTWKIIQIIWCWMPLFQRWARRL